jgi:hypothetical protein
MREPRNADPISDSEAMRIRARAVDDAYDLVTRYDLGMTRGEIALCEVQIGPTYSAREHPEADLAGPGRRYETFHELERMLVDGARFVDHPRLHGVGAHVFNSRSRARYM